MGEGDVVNAFFEKMEPGGFLLLGHAESLMSLSTGFDLVQLTHDLVYRKP
jgi:chemotaxis protein methyltransferase CheR